MKLTTLQKANELKERIDAISDNVIYGFSYPCSGKRAIANTVEFHNIALDDADAEELQKHIMRFLNKKKAALQKEFDNLK